MKYKTKTADLKLHVVRSKSYSTCNSQVVSYPSTKQANSELTAEIGRDPVSLECMAVADNHDCI